MTDQFVGEIRMFAGNFAPKYWAFCDGQLLTIAQNTALFSLLGTTYGGDGKTTFALPDLRGRAPIHQGQGPGLANRSPGEQGGQEAVTLSSNELPPHSHTLHYGTSSSIKQEPTNALWTSSGLRRSGNAYGDNTNSTDMSYSAVSPAGGNTPHNNMQPYVTVSYIIALQGIFPPRA